MRILCRPRHLWTFSIPAWLKIDCNSYCSMHMDSSVTYDQWGLWVPNWFRMLKCAWTFTSAKPNTWHTSRWSGNGISRRNCQILAENRDYHVFGLRWGVGLQYLYFVVSTQQNSPTLRHRKLLSFCMNTFLLHLSSSYKLNVSFFYFKLMSWQSSFVL